MKKSYLTKRTNSVLKLSVASLLVYFVSVSCKDTALEDPNPAVLSTPVKNYDVNLATKWADETLRLVRYTPGFTPPVASRALGYSALTMYESAVHGMEDYITLTKQLADLQSLPKPTANLKYNWGLVMNAAERQILSDLFPTTSEKNKVQADSLKKAIEAELIKKYTEDVAVVERSNAFGIEVAKAIFEYSKNDGGHEGYKSNFPSSYVVPVGMCFWEPTENKAKIPLQPYWGKNRTFVVQNQRVAIPTPKAASFSSSSDFFKEYQAVYQKNKILTQEEKEIAVWWADDPSETYTPPGHSYNLTKIAVQKSGVTLDKAIEAFAKTGIAVSDAFVLCWKTKYKHMNVRPYTYVREAIDPNWVPFWPAPPFPGFSSGHSTQSAATAIALESVFGSNFAFKDTSWEGRPKDSKRNVEFKSRSFTSFWQAAEESALSRFYGGIHTQMDNEVGLSHGKTIGSNVVALRFKK
jgi:PAP2 superfamily